MKFPERREDFDDYFIVCEDVSSHSLAFKDFNFDETMEVMLKLNRNRNTEFRMELCFDNPYLPTSESVPLFCIGVLVVDGAASGYADIHYNGTAQEHYPIDLVRVGKKMYGGYEFYSDTGLFIEGMAVINKYFNNQLLLI